MNRKLVRWGVLAVILLTVTIGHPDPLKFFDPFAAAQPSHASAEVPALAPTVAAPTKLGTPVATPLPSVTPQPSPASAEAPAFAAVTASTDLSGLTWRASPTWSGAIDGPVDGNGSPWWAPGFDDSTWQVTQLPDANSIPTGQDRFYRATFDISEPASAPAVWFGSDDGLWLYVNTSFVGHWGGDWREGGCVNNPEGGCSISTSVEPISLSSYLAPGQNVVAVRVSNGMCCGSYFDLTPTGGANSAFGSADENPDGSYSNEPVNLATGNLAYQHVDIDIPGRGPALLFRRSYNSQDSYAGALGRGWQSNYDMRLVIETEGGTVSAVTVVNEEGRRDRYVRMPDGSFSRPLQTQATLAENPDGYTLTTKAQVRYSFETDGVLLSIADRNGNTTRVSYYENGCLNDITDPGGRSLVFTTDYTNCRITGISDPLGRTVGFGYDGNGDLVTVTDVKGGQSHFTYDNHRMLTITDSLVHTQATNIYDSDGRVAEQTDAMGGRTCIYYGSGPTYPSEDCPGVSPGPSGNQTIVVDPLHNKTTYEFDSAYRTTEVTDALGGTINYAYDSTNNLTCLTNQLGKKTGYAYDVSGNLTQIVDALNTDASCHLKSGGVSWSYTYTAKNDINLDTDPRGNMTAYGYDTAGNLTSITQKDSGGTPLATTTLTRNASGNGDLTAQTDADGHTTTYTYDSQGLLQTADGPLAGPPNDLIQYSFDVGGRLNSVTDALARTTSYTYDNQNNVLTVTDANSPPGVTTYAYDAKGNRTSVTDAKRHPVGPPESGAQCGASGTGNGVDDDGDGVKDDGCPTTRFVYDHADHLKSVIDALGHATTYGYDADSNVSWLQDARHEGGTRRTDYTYDELNRLRKIQYPDANYNVGYGYDAAGRRTSMTDVIPVNMPPYRTRTTTYGYDDANRLLSVTASDTGAVSYTYDNAGNRTSITYPDGKAVTYTPDALNRIQSVADWRTPANVTSYGYDPTGNLLTTTYPSSTGIVSTRGYDSANRLASLVNMGGSNTLSSYAYTLDAVGNRTQMVDTTGTTTYNYDPLYRLGSVTYPGPSTTSYTYDAAGNRLTLNDSVNPTVNYTYDNANQLKQISGQPNNTYDANGNWIQSGTGITAPLRVLYDYENRPVRMGVCVGDVNGSGAVDSSDLLIVDKHLNTGEGDLLYDYRFDVNSTGRIDSSDQLIVARQSGIYPPLSCNDTAAYRYSGDGLRIETKQKPPGLSTSRTTTYVWDSAASLPVIVQDSTKYTISGYFVGSTSYVYGLDLLSATDNNSVTSYFLQDGLGSTTGLTSSSGTMTDSYTYDVFGATKTHTGSSANAWKFTGELNDTIVNQSPYYLRARYYDPAIGRFMSRDPMQGNPMNPQSLNRYAYALNNPALFVDLFGLCASEGGFNCSTPVPILAPAPPPTATPGPPFTCPATGSLGGDGLTLGDIGHAVQSIGRTVGGAVSPVVGCLGWGGVAGLYCRAAPFSEQCQMLTYAAGGSCTGDLVPSMVPLPYEYEGGNVPE